VTLGVLTEGELGALLHGFERNAFRFETRDRYNSDVGREPFRRYLAGETDDHAWHRDWLEMLRTDAARGRAWQRVRVVTVPLTDYNRYAIGIARLNVAAGEDIRYLSRDVAARIGLTPYDAWLLDDVRLVRLHFDDRDDTFRYAEIVDDTDLVTRHRDWRELAWRHASPLETFASAHL
jgi:hypothetical protein